VPRTTPTAQFFLLGYCAIRAWGRVLEEHSALSSKSVRFSNIYLTFRFMDKT